jgi:hypothetical protein
VVIRCEIHEKENTDPSSSPPVVVLITYPLPSFLIIGVAVFLFMNFEAHCVAAFVSHNFLPAVKIKACIGLFFVPMLHDINMSAFGVSRTKVNRRQTKSACTTSSKNNKTPRRVCCSGELFAAELLLFWKNVVACRFFRFPWVQRMGCRVAFV